MAGAASRFPQRMPVLDRARILVLEDEIDDAFASRREAVAEPMIREFLSISKASEDTFGVAVALNDLARVFLARGAYDSALSSVNLSTAAGYALQDTGAILMSLATATGIEMQRDSLTRARELLETSLALSRARPETGFFGIVANNFGALLERIGPQEAALGWYRVSAAAFVRGDSPSGAFMPLFNAAHLLQYNFHDFQAASSCYDSAAFYLSKRGFELTSRIDRVYFSGSHAGLFQEWGSAWLSGAALGLVRSDAAMFALLAIQERGRAQSLLDRTWRDFLPESLETNRHMPGANLPGEGADLVRKLRGKGQAYLSIAVHGDTLRTICFGQSGQVFFSSHSVPNMGALRMLDSVTRALNDTSNHAMTAYFREHPALLDTVLKLVSPILLPDTLLFAAGSAKKLVIACDGWPSLVPFCALVEPRSGKRLVSKFAIRFVPSLAWESTALAIRGGPGRSRRFSAGSVLIVGNPTGASLPHAQIEADSIATLLGAKSLTGDLATETRIRSRWAGARVIHFATHATTEFRDPARSAISLARDEWNDGYLELHEILEELPRSEAELIVLSACQTALGPMVAGEGILGLQRGLLRAGARTCIGTLWSVDGASAEAVMTGFYRAWSLGASRPSASEALRNAQLEILSRPVLGWSDPVFWAAFRVEGED